MLDRGRFPSASAYLSSLPKGLQSFPECRVRVLVFEHIGRQYPELARDAPPGPLKALLAGSHDSSEWLPEVVGQVANLMVRDVCVPSDEAYCDWTYEMSLLSFGKPMLRQLMRLMSPALLVLGAAKRWSALHAGTELGTSGVRTVDDRSEVSGHLRFPRGLFPELFLLGLCPAFRAALSLARGREIRVELGARSDVNAEYVVSWAS